MMALLKLVPAWLYVALICVALAIAGGVWQYDRGAAHVQSLWDADRDQRIADAADAVLLRNKENARQALAQKFNSDSITRKYHAEIDSVKRALAAAGRLRKPAFCADRPSSETDTASATSSDAADTGAGLVSDRVAADIESVILRTEEVAATGRACQSFVRANGMAP